MVKLMFGTPVTIYGYVGTCGRCKTKFGVRYMDCIYLSENSTSKSKRLRPITAIFCPNCNGQIGNIDMYGELGPSNLAKSN